MLSLPMGETECVTPVQPGMSHRPPDGGNFVVRIRPQIQNTQHQTMLGILWWGRTDSNHRSETQQIYSLSPLATRELPRMKLDALEPVWSR